MLLDWAILKVLEPRCGMIQPSEVAESVGWANGNLSNYCVFFAHTSDISNQESQIACSVADSVIPVGH